MSAYDVLFSTPLDKNARFSFDEEVVACFPDMIRRSVPGYGQMLAMLPIFAKNHCQGKSRIYDLGTSLGAVSLALAGAFDPDVLEIYAVDVSEPMINKAAKIMQQNYPDHCVHFVCEDINRLKLLPCDMIVLNLTLQFLAPSDRLALLQKCHHALNAGGVLILTEKTHLTDAKLDAYQVARYYDFKRNNGYSELEISTKRDALENVLITDTPDAHQQRLLQAGFAKTLVWFQFFNFLSFAAFKE